MLGKSARTVSHELYREKRVYIALTSYWLAEGVATIICYCSQLVFMLFTIGLWHRAGFSHYGSWPQMGSRNAILRFRNRLAWQISYNNFCKIYNKIESRPAVKSISTAFLFLGAISYFMLSVVYYDTCLSYKMLIKTRHNKLCVAAPWLL